MKYCSIWIGWNGVSARSLTCKNGWNLQTPCLCTPNWQFRMAGYANVITYRYIVRTKRQCRRPMAAHLTVMIFNRPTERWMRSKARSARHIWKGLGPTHHAHSRTQINGSMCYILNFNSRHARAIKKLLLQFFLNIFHFSGTDKNCVNFATYTFKRKLLTNFKSILFEQVIFHFWTKTQKNVNVSLHLWLVTKISHYEEFRFDFSCNLCHFISFFKRSRKQPKNR